MNPLSTSCGYYKDLGILNTLPRVNLCAKESNVLEQSLLEDLRCKEGNFAKIPA
eukprot:CAMPEP_0114293340 /NCGR_PEP_ID=MMETSP0059-20121206/9543_1 /TAXON_ID=36894 /ORGANISM="Pyramimonas parkeae, Strain CCMP726" /LENGTH=53 /DNA_ID=CAMNT_0001415049 /DNA_START=1792 /DNA_END=1956 /DNA_ORIENTATION=+